MKPREANFRENAKLDRMVLGFAETYKLTEEEMQVLVRETPPGELFPLLSNPQGHSEMEMPPLHKALARIRASLHDKPPEDDPDFETKVALAKKISTLIGISE